MGLLILMLVLGGAVGAGEADRFSKFALCEENGYSVDFGQANLGQQYGIDNGPTLSGFGANITVATPLFSDLDTPAAAIMLLEMGTFGIDFQDEDKTQLGYGVKLGSFHPAQLVEQKKRFHIFVGAKLTLDLFLTFYNAVSSSGPREFGVRPENCTRPAAAFLVGVPEALKDKEFVASNHVERKNQENQEFEL